MHVYGYLKKNQKPFSAVPFNAVDALAISWMAYFDFASVKEKLPLTIKGIENLSYFKKLDPYNSSFVPKYSRKFMHAIAHSTRFRGAELLDYDYVLDKNNAAQFCVIAVRVYNLIVVAFKGTDDSYTGWREDFELSYKDKIASYSLAEKFLKNIMKQYEENIVLCGHSKGGNIATYLLSQVKDDSRIEHVYSFDGPGFRIQGLFEKKEDRLAKFTKIIPQSSIVGVLFSNETDVKIIKSGSYSLAQHIPLVWYVKNNDFIYLKKRTLSSRYLETTINAWINSLEDEEKKRFTEIIFGELDKLDPQDFISFFKKILFQLKPIYEAYLALDMDDKKLLFKVYFKLVRNMILPEKKKQIESEIKD